MQLPPYTIGILGGGQLAKMLAIAATAMGCRVICIEPNEEACAASVAEIIHAKWDDLPTLESFAQECDVITFENENIPLETIEFLKTFCPVYPDQNALRITQDRLFEKDLFGELGIPTNRFIAVNSLPNFYDAAEELGFPCLVKTRRFGYDGKGQFMIKNHADIDLAWRTLGIQPLILEAFIEIETEISIIATRNARGKFVYYPMTENNHQEGILRLSQAPYYRPALEKAAVDYMEKVLSHFNYVGTLAIEFFITQDKLLANEMAPRVHNSGHWTIEGAVTSQFENHLRAILGLSLGSTDAIGYSAMVNCIGSLPDLDKILAIPHAHYHVYGKTERALRKVGHVTINTATKSSTKHYLSHVTTITE